MGNEVVVTHMTPLNAKDFKVLFRSTPARAHRAAGINSDMETKDCELRSSPMNDDDDDEAADFEDYVPTTPVHTTSFEDTVSQEFQDVWAQI